MLASLALDGAGNHERIDSEGLWYRGALRCRYRLSSGAVGCDAQGTTPPTEWTVWGGDAAQTHFSPLTQITPQNVAQLRPVWIYNPGTTGRGWENTPLLVDGRLYVSDPTGDILALDPTNGDPIWRWKSPQRVSRVRGLAYWAGDGTMKPRLLATRNGQVLGFDLKTGVPVTDWPDGGFNLGFPRRRRHDHERRHELLARRSSTRT